jgi:hypothetical protein
VNPQQNRSSQNFSRHHLRYTMANQLLNADAEVLSIKIYRAITGLALRSGAAGCPM